MEIAHGVFAVARRSGRGAYASGRAHAYLLVDEDTGLTLIDTLYDTDARLILNEFRRLGLKVADLERILITHGHRSHLGGLATLKRLSRARVHAHPWEVDVIEGERAAQPVTLRPVPPLSLYPLRAAFGAGMGKHPPCSVDRFLSDGDTQGPVEALHTPGHTPGHMSFYWRERGVLFTGDAVATWPRFGAGWSGFNLNPRQHLESLQKMADLSPEVVAVGHGDPITRGAAKRLRDLAFGKAGSPP